MTLVELIGLAQGETQNALAITEYNLATITGYLLIAYFIGANLTLFQVSFVNFLFVLSRIAAYFSLQGILERTQHFQQQIVDADPNVPVGALATGGYGSVAQTVLFTAVTVGCLVFMWQVRHPKTE